MDMADWVVVAVEEYRLWPESEMRVQFRARELILRAGEGDLYPDVSLLRAPNESYYEAATLVHRFLSALCWVKRTPLITTGHSGGTHRTPIGGRPARPSVPWISSVVSRPEFTISSLPEVLTPESELALALYREALGLNHVTYQFLAFFKILNIRHASGSDQIAWINSVLGNVPHPAAQRVQTLQKSHPNVGEYLFVQGRCAVAHANAPPTVDPDRIDQTSQFHSDLLIVRNLAECFMETELAIPR